MMPIHDWKRVDAGVFHDFHSVWISLLRNAMNEGLLPAGFYAMSEQHAGKYIPDILSLQKPSARSNSPSISGGLAVAEAPPKVRRQVSLSAAYKTRRRSLAIRHISENRLVAIVEIVSPGNKDRHEHVVELLDKFEDVLALGVHLLVVDLFKPGKNDPHGLHGALWERLGDEPDDPPADEPLTFGSYVADSRVKAFLEYRNFGQQLPEMPLFLDPDTYVNTPLEATYDASWRGTPDLYREELERVD